MTEQPDNPNIDEESQEFSNDKPESINKAAQKGLYESLIYRSKKAALFGEFQPSNKEDKKENIDSSFSENEQDSQKQEDNRYRRMSEDLLQDLVKRINKDIEICKKDEAALDDEVEQIKEDLRYAGSGKAYRDQKRELKENLVKRDACRQKLEELYSQRDKISEELDGRKKDGNKFAEHIDSVSVQSLFLENEPIENTVLYVATFFTDLSPSDFKRVVAKFLGDRTVSITKSQTITEDGKSKIIETPEEQKLLDKWKKSIEEAHQVDKILKKCYLKVTHKEHSQIVDFLSPKLRMEFNRYFREEQAFYIEEQYKYVSELLFDDSENVANSAINLLAEAATYYTNDNIVRWLLEITFIAEEKLSIRLFGRVSKLISEMQIILNSEQSERIIKRFLDDLLEQGKTYVFEITLYLVYEQLWSSYFSKIRSLKQLLDWLKQVLDQGEKEEKAKAYSVLERLLSGRYIHKYIYDILRILKAWLPESECPIEKYSSSNHAAILLLLNYCEATIEELPIGKYGCWPSEYPLFTSMHNDSDVDSSLNLLVSWLFHPSANQGLAINYAFTDEMNAIGFIGFMIAEWFTILYGLQEDKVKPEASKLADRLLRQVLIITDEHSEQKQVQKQLTKFWVLLANAYLEKSASYAQSTADKQLKRAFVCRRKLVKELINNFKTLQQEVLTAR